MESTIADLVREFRKLIHETFVSARLGNKSAEWIELRKTWLGTGNPSFTKAGAADLNDVRDVFVAMQFACETQTAEQAQTRGSTALELQQLRMSLHAQLAKIVATELDKYRQVSQEKSSISDLFAASTPKPGGYGYSTSKPATSVMTCASCGAPRGDDSLYGNCQYCGQPLFAATEKS